MTSIDTTNGRIISHCPISPDMAAAADECFAAYKFLNEKVEKFKKTIPESFSVKNFYGNGELVIIQSQKELDDEAKYWEENS